MDRLLKRREFLKIASAGVVGTIASACAPQTIEVIRTVEVEKEVEKEVIKTVEVEKEVEKIVEVEVSKGFVEPPMLEAKVAAGEIPPVEERLPETPAVISGRDAIGVYGGEVRMTAFDPVWFMTYGWFSERFLSYSDSDIRTIVPAIFESWEVSDDGKTYTFYLRKGMKWSDGQPVTSEDIRFWWEDTRLDPDIGYIPVELSVGGAPMVLEVVDEYTVKFIFAGPYGNFPAQLTRWHVYWEIMLPSHVLKQYHAKYNDPAKLDEQAKEESMEGWGNLFNFHNQWGAGIWQGPPNYKELPTLSAWLLKDIPQEGILLWERNPYYWKVDLAGNQLPYIDNIRHDRVQNKENLKLKLIQSEVDYIGPHDVTIADYPYYTENAAKANYVVTDYLSSMTDRYVLLPQHTLSAEQKPVEDIINHPNFVKALSMAIDRSEINESLFFGLARVGQLSPMPDSKLYKEKYGTAWAQFDPDMANQLLDEMGLDKRDAEGFRLRPDGERFDFFIQHSGVRVGSATNQFTEMVVTFWRQVGINANTSEITEALYRERMRIGEVHCGVWHSDRCTDMLIHIEPNWFVPVSLDATGGYRWGQWWNSDDKEGLEPPPDYVQQLHELFRQSISTISEDERVNLWHQILDIVSENPLSIGVVLESPAPLIFNRNLRNLPRPKMPIGWDSWGVSTYHPEAFYYEGGQRA